MTGQQDKVVSISTLSAKESSPGIPSAARMPIALRKLQDKSRQSLMTLLQGLFDNADDSLFELADKAQSNSEQNIYFDSMREIRLQRRVIEAQFAQVIPQCFDDTYAGRSIELLAGKVEEVDETDLSLIQNEELEQSVAIDTMVAKALLSNTDELVDLTARVNTLVESESIDENGNPVGPKAVCYAFKHACDILNIDIKSRLVLFKLFEKFVVAALPELYHDCNVMLVEDGVLPNLRPGRGAIRSQARKSHRPGMSAANMGAASEDVANSLQAIAQVTSGHVPSTSDKTFSHLQKLISQYESVASPAPMADRLMPGAGPQLQTGQLLELLAQIQHMQEQNLAQMLGQQAPGDWDTPLSDVPGLLNKALASLPAGAPAAQQLANDSEARSATKPRLGQVDYDAMNLVSMLFQFILDDQNLPLPMKALIARLQIPVLKVAMMDKSFFSKGGHPVRQLLNKIATAALGWTPELEDKGEGSNGAKKDALLERVESIVEQILQGFTNDISLFESILAEFNVFLASESRRASLIEKRTIDAESGKARADDIRLQVQQALNYRISGKKVPVLVTELLRDAWSNALFLICIKQGAESEEWHQALAVVDDLLWSVSEQAGEDRDQLMALLPNLLRSLRTGLTQINFDAFKMNELFAQLEHIHLRRLRNEALAPEKTAEKTPDKAVATAPDISPESVPDLAPDPQAADVERSPETRVKNIAAEKENPAKAEDALADMDSVDQMLARSILEDAVDDGSAADAVDDANHNDAAEAADQELSSLDELHHDEAMIEETVTEIILVADESDAEANISDEENEFYQQAKALSVGVWLEIRQGEGKKFRAKLAAITRPNNKYIFVNRAGMKVCERTIAGVAVELQRGSIALLDDSQLFDRALQSVIGTLRQVKN